MISRWLHDPEFWVLLGFVIFIVAVWKKAGQLIGSALDARSARIRQQIAEAEKLRAEAETMLREAEARKKASIKEIEDILALARDEAKLIHENSAKELSERLARRKQGALDKIAQAEAAAIAEVRQVAVDVAIAATQRLLVAQVQGAIADRMIDEAIAELPRRLS